MAKRTICLCLVAASLLAAPVFSSSHYSGKAFAMQSPPPARDHADAPRGKTHQRALQRPKPQPSRCLWLARQIGASRVWWGQHVGTRQRSDFFEWGPSKEQFDEIGCFRSRQECEDWLIWKRDEYPEFFYARPCRLGL